MRPSEVDVGDADVDVDDVGDVGVDHDVGDDDVDVGEGWG